MRNFVNQREDLGLSWGTWQEAEGAHAEIVNIELNGSSSQHATLRYGGATDRALAEIKNAGQMR